MSTRKRKKVNFADAVKTKPWVEVLIPAQKESGRAAGTNIHMPKKAYGKPVISTTKGTSTTYPASGKSSVE